jgi:hypothetical protein
MRRNPGAICCCRRFADRKMAIQNAAAGTQFNWTYLLERALGPDYITKFATQKPVVMATGAQMVDGITRGEVLLGAALDHWRGFGPAAEQAAWSRFIRPRGCR